MTTNETAKAILDGDWTIICEAIDSPEQVADLQAMAKLWLMRDEIIEALDDCPDSVWKAVVAKITAIAGESKDDV